MPNNPVEQICLDWIENMKVCTGHGNVQKIGKTQKQICLDWIENMKLYTGPGNAMKFGKALE